LKGPLHGIRVVEMGNAIAGPLCASLLGDMGADVIKVEPLGKGDDSRRWGAQVNGESPYFIQYNRSKRSIALDVKHPRGKKVLEKLIRRSDVLVENFRPGTLANLGFSYPKLKKLNPRLVCCSVSGFGQTGPYRSLGGYDAIVQGMSGIMAVTGDKDDPPLRTGAPITDIAAALYASFSIALALYARNKSGKGQIIDVSLFESGVSTVAQWITINALTHARTPRFGNRYPLLAPYELFRTKDKAIVVAIGNDVLWKKLCDLIGKPELADDPRFRTNLDRIKGENRPALADLLQRVFLDKPASHWINSFWKEGIPAGPINRIEELASDEQLISRGAFSAVKHPTLGKIEVVSALPKLSGTPGRVAAPPPKLGEHTNEILRELGYTPQQAKRLKKEGVV
jgi:crotonobetainyl-CoA:carnitine CoA-transferase CaiB-like acyl-CoA transferase